MRPAHPFQQLRAALPFWASLLMLPVVGIVAGIGGWTLILVPLASWWLFSVLDLIIGSDTTNPDPATPERDLFWHRLITLIWPVLQAILIFGMIAYATRAAHLNTVEKVALFFGVGVISGTIGIVYAHELMHQRNRVERALGDVLMAMTLYGHYRSEHLLVHHTHVGTPRDAVTGRYNEGFHRFFSRVLRDSARSAWRAETAMQARRGTRDGIPRTRSGAIGRCNWCVWRWLLPLAAGPGSVCLPIRRSLQCGSLSW